MIPDEHGWYWALITQTGQWCMAHVHTGVEMVRLYDGNDPSDPQYNDLDEESLVSRYGPIEWHGPIHCPGGDFGQHTILVDRDTMLNAQETKTAIVIEHFDFRFCPWHTEQLTRVRAMSESEASLLAYGDHYGN